MSNSIFCADIKEDHDNDNNGDSDHSHDRQKAELYKEDEELIDNSYEDDNSDKKEEEIINFSATADDDYLEKKQQQLGDGLSSTNDDEDGFRTPTSLEHRIPVPTQCPPAPKKSNKRKIEESSITEIVRSIHDEFMIFKKARQDDDALA